jgi:lipopolysaccharide/colanic/teichoic acid biosynthesis glycosyltransferase
LATSGERDFGLVDGHARPDDVVGPARRESPISELALWTLNFSVAAISVILLFPLLVIIATAIKLDSRGPVFYRQVRVGLDRRDGVPDRPAGRRAADRGLERAEFDGQDRRLEQSLGSPRRAENAGGRPFLIYKFRTMHVDAEEQTGPVWAAATDVRTTRLGRFLRRYRLDEIPQFWNVLRGEMAVVGPRPERPSFFRHLRREIRDYPARQKVKPGITGLAQVSQAADQTVDDVRKKLDFDLDYVQRRSLAYDLRIMLKTLPVMLGQEHDASRASSGEREDHTTRS